MTTANTPATMKNASKMSSSASRLITKSSPSTHRRNPAIAPIMVLRDTRRASRMTSATINEPKTSEGKRQPNEFIPNSHSPEAISHLPTCGWTMNEAFEVYTFTLPAATSSLAFSGHDPSYPSFMSVYASFA